VLDDRGRENCMRLSSTILLAVMTAGLALAAGRPALNVYFQSNLTEAAYQKKTFDRVAKAWKTPAAPQIPEVGKKAVVQAVIGRDGGLMSAFVSLKSGKKGWDEAVLKAVKAASPFDPLPAGFKPPSVEVHFHVGVVP
jgi:protein TonB